MTTTRTPAARGRLTALFAAALLCACGGGRSDGATGDGAQDGAASPAPAASTPSASAPASAPSGAPSASSPAASAPAGSPPASSPSGATHLPRPAGNTGHGFYVSGSKLVDPNGVEFRVRGVNRTHWDQSAGGPGAALAGANAVRIALDFRRPAASNWTLLQTQMLALHMVPIAGNWGGTCSGDPAKLAAIVDTWIAQADTWRQLGANGLLNIANEWGPAKVTNVTSPGGHAVATPNTIWRDGYVAAIQRLRAVGFDGALVVDAGGCGQDAATVLQDGAAVLAADPQHNVLFDVHVYGGFHWPKATAGWQQDYTTALDALAASGLPVMLGEFGPGADIGPSPTLLPPATLVADAEARGFGWLAWSWDDNDLAGCRSDDHWFSLTNHCGQYATDADLTAFGRTIVPLLKSLAVPATSF